MSKKILIVEDDINYRFAIKETIPWEEHGFCIVGEAIHGKQAMEFLEKQVVDIILTDMSMPLMNGVELIKRVSEKYPDIIMIALSAYDDFPFVKESLKYGAKDYILKQELNPKDMIETLKRVCNEKEQRNFESVSKEEWEHELRLVLRKDKKLEEKTIQYFQKLIPQCPYFAMIISDKKENLIGILSELRKNDKVLYAISDHESKILVLWKIIGSMSRDNITDQMRELAAMFINKLDAVCKIYMSKESGAGFNISDLLKQVSELQELQIYYKGTSIFLYYDLESKIIRRKKDYLYSPDESLIYDSIEKVREQLNLLVNKMKDMLPSDEYLNKNFLLLCEFFMKQKNQSGWRQVTYYEKLLAAKSLNEKTDCFMQEITNAWSQLEQEYFGNQPEIAKALSYIRKHYMQDISLLDVAEHVRLSENYFSNLFKIEMNENLTHYINRLRIGEAKRLMDTTNLKVYEIAESVGYHNATYFSTMFKKMTNMAITDYRKNPK